MKTNVIYLLEILDPSEKIREISDDAFMVGRDTSKKKLESDGNAFATFGSSS